MIAKLKDFVSWYGYTATIVGYPVLLVVIFIVMQKLTFTSTCMTLGYKCENAIGADQGLASYMGDMLDANPNVDIITKPKGKR